MSVFKVVLVRDASEGTDNIIKEFGSIETTSSKYKWRI
jgi:hypothetical protein